MKSLKPYISYLKLRGSYGIVGNDIVSDGSRFLYLPDAYTISTEKYGFGQLSIMYWLERKNRELVIRT